MQWQRKLRRVCGKVPSSLPSSALANHFSGKCFVAAHCIVTCTGFQQLGKQLQDYIKYLSIKLVHKLISHSRVVFFSTVVIAYKWWATVSIIWYINRNWCTGIHIYYSMGWSVVWQDIAQVGGTVFSLTYGLWKYSPWVPCPAISHSNPMNDVFILYLLLNDVFIVYSSNNCNCSLHLSHYF